MLLNIVDVPEATDAVVTEVIVDADTEDVVTSCGRIGVVCCALLATEVELFDTLGDTEEGVESATETISFFDKIGFASGGGGGPIHVLVEIDASAVVTVVTAAVLFGTEAAELMIGVADTAASVVDSATICCCGAICCTGAGVAAC